MPNTLKKFWIFEHTGKFEAGQLPQFGQLEVPVPPGSSMTVPTSAGFQISGGVMLWKGEGGTAKRYISPRMIIKARAIIKRPGLAGAVLETPL